jgi:hypothetical protein
MERTDIVSRISLGATLGPATHGFDGGAGVLDWVEVGTNLVEGTPAPYSLAVWDRRNHDTGAEHSPRVAVGLCSLYAPQKPVFVAQGDLEIQVRPGLVYAYFAPAGVGASLPEILALPEVAGAVTFELLVDWGDANGTPTDSVSASAILSGDDLITHTYAEAGDYHPVVSVRWGNPAAGLPVFQGWLRLTLDISVS